MTSIPEATEALYGRFKDEWIGVELVYFNLFGAELQMPVNSGDLIPYCWDNIVIDPPAGPDGKGAPWARFSVRHSTSGQETLGQPGNRKFMRTGRAFTQLFVPPGTGRAVTDDLMEAARAMFEGRAITGTTIRFRDVNVTELGEVDDGRWWASTCEAVFEYDQIR